jgi:hypothetical protein
MATATRAPASRSSRGAGFRRARSSNGCLGSLSTMADILSWTAGDLDPARLNVQASLARMVLMIGARAGLLDDRATTAKRLERLEELACQRAETGA